MSDVGLIILAAGASRRLGQPKQLLLFQEQSLIRHTAKIALNSACHPVIAVIGAYAEQMRSQLFDLPIFLLENPNWSDGMSTSIRWGIQEIQRHSTIEAVILSVCDQPFLSTPLIDRLVNTYRTTQSLIVATNYANSLGVPALFHCSLFQSLCSLSGDVGAKRIIQQYIDSTSSIPFPQGNIDIDTIQDWQDLFAP